MNNFVEKALLAAIQAATRANDKVLVGLLEEAKAEVSHYNEKLNNAYAENARLSQDYDLARANAAEKTKRVLDLQADVTRLDNECAALTRDLSNARRENEQLLASRDAMVTKFASIKTCGCSYDNPDDVCLHHSPKLIKVQAEIDQMREALEPFAKTANDFDNFTNKQPDGWIIYSGGNSSYNYISVGHLRQARKVWEKDSLDD